MKKFCFTVDDNIRCFKWLTFGSYDGIFGHPYLGVYKRLHEQFGLKVQLNLFYKDEEFNLSDMTARYKSEWRENSDWLKLSFHSREENVKPYEFSKYDEVFFDCANVQREIIRFASPSALAITTTIHYCLATSDGIKALKDNGVAGLLGLYGDEICPRASYRNTEKECEEIRRGGVVFNGGIGYAGIDIVLNNYSAEEILLRLNALKDREFIKVMIHEQYFYSDYRFYQRDFEEKLCATFDFLSINGFESVFFEECI